MSRLYPTDRRKFQKFLGFVGCHLKRTSGDHLIYWRTGLKRPVVITADKKVPIFIIRNNLRTLGLSPEEYLEILERAT